MKFKPLIAAIAVFIAAPAVAVEFEDYDFNLNPSFTVDCFSGV